MIQAIGTDIVLSALPMPAYAHRCNVLWSDWIRLRPVPARLSTSLGGKTRFRTVIWRIGQSVPANRP